MVCSIVIAPQEGEVIIEQIFKVLKMADIKKIGTTAALFVCFNLLMPEVNIVKAKGKGKHEGDSPLSLSKEDIAPRKEYFASVAPSIIFTSNPNFTLIWSAIDLALDAILKAFVALIKTVSHSSCSIIFYNCILELLKRVIKRRSEDFVFPLIPTFFNRVCFRIGCWKPKDPY